MSHRLVLPLLLLLAAPTLARAAGRDPAEDAYQAARGSYFSLKSDAARRKLRHNWLNVAHRFEQVAHKYPKNPRAPDALYTAAELLNELSRISRLDEDLAAAVADYQRILDKHPQSRLADDAALQLARIRLDRLDQPEAARKVIAFALERTKRGDQTRMLKELMARLPPEPEPAPAAVAKKAELAPAPKKAEPHAQEVARREARPTAEPRREEPAQVARKDTKGEAHAEPRREQPAAAPASAGDALAVAPSSRAAAEQTGPQLESVGESSHPSGALVDAIGRAARAPSAASLAASAAGKGPEDAGVSRVLVRSQPAVAGPTVAGTPATAADDALAEEDEEDFEGEEGDDGSMVVRADPRAAKARLKAVARNGHGSEMTLAEQLGLKVRRVVIDAGHGGHDTGAIGRSGVREKDVTLSIARKLAAVLSQRGLEVVLTRGGDKYLKLEDRARKANEARGDLFISIHCNSAPRRSKARGVETYTLNTTADRYSIRLAARENASSERGISDLQFILADLATKANTEESNRLASQVQRSMVSQLNARYRDIKDLGTKEALFYVLLGVRMPAILVEASFLSHPEEEKRLGSARYQDEVARAIAHGVEEFIDGRQGMARRN